MLVPQVRHTEAREVDSDFKGISRCSNLAVRGCTGAIGGKDVQVLLASDLHVIEDARKRGGNGQFEVRELPGLNHFLQTARTGSPEEYGTIEETMSPEAMDAITEWILGRVSDERLSTAAEAATDGGS